MLPSLWLVHPDADACEAFRQRFDGLPRVRVFQTKFEDLPPHDCFVTAGNSYGLMTAGIDAVVVERFGEQIMQAVQLRILSDYFGEQPVGTAFVLPTGDERIPFLCHAPTMRVPQSIDGTEKVYLATFAALVTVFHHNRTAEHRNGGDAGDGHRVRAGVVRRGRATNGRGVPVVPRTAAQIGLGSGNRPAEGDRVRRRTAGGDVKTEVRP